MVLPHELVNALHKRGQLDNMYDMQELREFWNHMLGHACSQVPWPCNIPEMTLPGGLHGDDCRFTETGQKIIVLSWNLVMDSSQTRYPLAVVRFVTWLYKSVARSTIRFYT